MRYIIMCSGITAVNKFWWKRSKSRCDVIVGYVNIIRIVFDRMRYIDYYSSVNLSYGLFFNNPIWSPDEVLEYLWNQKWNQNLNIIAA